MTKDKEYRLKHMNGSLLTAPEWEPHYDSIKACALKEARDSLIEKAAKAQDEIDALGDLQ